MAMGNNQVLSEQSPAKADLNKRLEEIGWGLFLLMIGGLILVPDEQLPHGVWLVGVGVIMLGLNVIRYFNNIKVSGFTITVGILALVVGLAGFYGIKLPLFAIFLLVIGAGLIFRALIGPKS